MMDQERRRYYRINDVIGLKYSQVIDSIQSPEKECISPSVTLPEVLKDMDTELSQLANAITHSQPAIAKALDLINRKISLLAEQINESEEIRNMHQTNVNLSACGIAFFTDEEVHIGSLLNITMTLKPAQSPILLKGRVISCEKRLEVMGDQYWLRVEYSDPDHMVKELLIQHVVKKEYHSIREQRAAMQEAIKPFNCAT